ncbi:hypothetical protein AVHY2522_23770 [Acidovorax sp. SUPP2522]|uniref:hypothetical protein n=1 Tax=unclassified Acidovorax TaxID=2684926 RepID=UPI00234B862E|nr:MULTISPECIES: hypothetical protein [unclassified Acidovorax]WCM96246.1 hypothetical protein M5C96_17645 [Acidovorax sp. GBBC 1281]GKT19790.1 hypothetical protein AVHY2522_23770 [Acidovorax sp. SUPP2522]
MIETQSAEIPAALGRPAGKEKAGPTKATRQRIWEAITEMFHADQVVTRECLVEVTGLKMTIIDDHVGRMVESGELRRVRAGVFVPVPRYSPPRPVYGSMTTDGFFVLEVGDQKVVMQPREARQAGALMAGQFMQLAAIQMGHDTNLMVNELHRELKQLKRDLGE